MNEAISRMLSRYDCRRVEDYVRALREILQEIALLGLWRSKFYERAALYGGTALRTLRRDLTRKAGFFSNPSRFQSGFSPFRTCSPEKCTRSFAGGGRPGLRGVIGMTWSGSPRTIPGSTFPTLSRG